jgi:hypothetical protein
MDEAVYVVFLDTYFKGDREDLSQAEYKELAATADSILAQPMLHEWD